MAFGRQSAIRHWHRIGLGIAAAGALTGIALLGASSDPAEAYVGSSYIALPGIVNASGGSGTAYRGWLRISAHYWKTEDSRQLLGGRSRMRRDRMYFSGPPAPRKGASELVISVDKRSRGLPALMAQCARKAVIPELTFAESSIRARGLAENGPKPKSFPDFYEYKLKTVQVASCPVVADAPEQAIVLSSQDIQWLNYDGPDMVDNVVTPVAFQPLTVSGVTKTFVLSWFAIANDVSDGQCPQINAKPTEADYYALMSPADAAARKEALSKIGGVGYENEEMAHRGPAGINACLLPGIIPAKVPHYAPVSDLARGLDLDGDDGRGAAPKGICRHRNYRSDDGRSGIDNQVFTVQGCMPGYQGHKGFLMQYRNEQRRNGLLAMMVQISGIDDDKNDNEVYVSVLYSKDPMAKNASGSQILPDFTFRLTDLPEFRYYFTRVRGRIVNGVIETDKLPLFQMHPGIDSEVTLHDAAFRLRIEPDGKLKGIVGGYEDWRRLMAMNANSRSESLYGFQCQGLYQAFRGEADGMKNPETGECDGISSAYDLEGVPAMVPPEQMRSLVVAAR